MGETLLKVTTDKLAAYKKALEKQLTNRPYHYLQIVKRRVKGQVSAFVEHFFDVDMTKSQRSLNSHD